MDHTSSKAPITKVSVWAFAPHICLDQAILDERGNEVTAITERHEAIKVCGCLVSIDAMGCQSDIAANIIAATIISPGTDYCLAVIVW